MVKLEWIDRYLTGVEEIDDDHKKILQIMKGIEESIQKQDNDRCTSFFNDLLDLVATHSLNEENYLAEVSYPYIEEHIRYHQDLLDKIKAAQALCGTAENHGALEKHFNDMAEFLVDDIFGGDLQFKEYLEARGDIK